MPELREASDESDASLMALVCQDSPDERALDALVNRYWAPLFGRCQLLTLNSQRASDLAQDAWCRVLRARRSLKPDGNFPAYLMTVATNLWRDSNRSERRAGLMAERHLASLDETVSGENGESVVLGDLLPDVNALQGDERIRLKLDIDAALGELPPPFREVLVARYIAGESAAEIGRRFGRTEQTITAWVRDALQRMKTHLAETRCAATDEATS